METDNVRAINGVSNGGSHSIELAATYSVNVELLGSAPILFHRWNCEAVAEKSAAKKGSKAKKSDDIESYVYRNEKGELCIPGTYLTGSICTAAKYFQDPRSPRKSAMDLFKAGVVPLTILASTGKKDWDFVDQRRVTIQRAGITRCRPALNTGWKVEFDLQVLLPDYIRPELLLDVLNQAGRLVGLADFRPTYGRYQVSKFNVEQ